MTGRHHVVMTGRHHADKQWDDRVSPEVWPTEDDRLAVEDTRVMHPVVSQVDAPVFGPVSLVEQERAACREDVAAERVAEVEAAIRWTPRWLLVRLAVGTAVLVVAIVLTAVLAGCTTTTAGTPGAAPTPSQLPLSPSLGVREPEEDEPGFDCHTMRNRVCGPTEVRA